MAQNELFGRRKLFVLGVAEAENHHENWLEKDETDSKAVAFAEGLGEFDVHNDTEHKVSAWNDGEEAEHWFHVQNLEKGVRVVDRDESLPAFFASFFENLPHGNNHNDARDQGNE